jgi:anti-sigma B factor antagonist
MDGFLRFQLDWDGAVDTLHVAGELDIATAPELEHTVDAALDGRSGDFRVNLSGLTFVDSTGAQALLHAHNSVESRGRRLALVAAQRPVRRALEVMGLCGVLDLEDDHA